MTKHTREGEVSERVVFAEESTLGRGVKLVASGEVDETLLDALIAFTQRQRKRLAMHETEPQFPDEGVP